LVFVAFSRFNWRWLWPLRWDWQVAIRGEICGLAACTRQIWRIAKYTLFAIYGDFLDFLAIIRHN